MKKLFFILILSLIGYTHAFAAADLPSSSVWFEPATAKAGEAITLNALVYNNQSIDATVTVAFSTTTTKLGTATLLVPKESAKTLQVSWKMPAQGVIVEASVVTAVDRNKKTIPALVGTLGSTTVAVASTSIVSTAALPLGSFFNKYLGPTLATIETFRVKEAVYFSTLRDSTRAKSTVQSGSNPKEGVASQALGSPTDVVTILYASACAGLFTNMVLFYITLILAILLVLRIIVKMIF